MRLERVSSAARAAPACCRPPSGRSACSRRSRCPRPPRPTSRRPASRSSVGHPRAAAHRVDHEVGGEPLAVLGAHARDAQRAVALAASSRAAATPRRTVEPVLRARPRVANACSSVGLRAVTVVEHRSSPGRGSRSAIVGGIMRPQSSSERARVEQRVEHVGQLGVEHVAPARLQVVRLPELRDAAGAPTPPTPASGVRGRRRRDRARAPSPRGRPSPASARRPGRRRRRRARSPWTW